MSDRKAYPSDLTDAEWEILEPLIPAISEEAAHGNYTRREIVNAILYVLRSGCPWRLLPNDLPSFRPALRLLSAVAKARHLGSGPRSPAQTDAQKAGAR